MAIFIVQHHSAEKPNAEAPSTEKPNAEAPPAEKPNVEAPSTEKPADPKQENNTAGETTQEKVPVTWKGDKEYTPDQNSKVIYTAVLPEGYVLAEGVTLPVIQVMVGRLARDARAAEQFSLRTGTIYYFDLSNEVGNVGTINPAVADQTLHYVPFTYAGTVNAYSLDSSSNSITNSSLEENVAQSNRSLFVADYNISYSKSWNDLHAANLIFGKPFDTNYKLRTLSGGGRSNDNASGLPAYNEWDSILNKSSGGIKNWENITSLGQDTVVNGSVMRVQRGGSSSRYWFYKNQNLAEDTLGYRPALEVMNVGTLGYNGLKEVILNLNSGSFDWNGSVGGGAVSSLSIVCAGETFKAPSGTGLTRPNGNTDTYFGWNTEANGSGTSYAVGADVPKTVTNLYAQWKKPVDEQFSLATGQTYYFDLSGEAGNVGTINTAVPDTSLHYVPFTYAGTVNAYSLDSADSGIATTQARADALLSDRSLFVADYGISHSESWNVLKANNLIFGKTFDTNYKLRSLSAGSNGDAQRGTPITNEWDNILNKSSTGIKNWSGFRSFGQDTVVSNTSNRACRGNAYATSWDYCFATGDNTNLGFRPALEVLDPTTLGKDDLKAVTLDLNGGKLKNDTSINIVCAGATFTAPSGEGLTRPSGDTGNSFGWNTVKDGSGTRYEAGATDVPNTVTKLYAQWKKPVTEQFELPIGGTYYFDLSAEAGTITSGVSNKIGTINTTVPDTTLHYVPFTYAGTVNAYSLELKDSGNTGASATAPVSDRSLFVADYNISHKKSWTDLKTIGLIFGKTFDTNYKLRALSEGSNATGSGDAQRVTPTTNEWDCILTKRGLTDPIKNWQDRYSYGQDTYASGTGACAHRGKDLVTQWSQSDSTSWGSIIAFRPALEVLNPSALTADGLKAVTLNLNGGSFDSNGSVADGVVNSLNIICAGDTFKAPSGEGLIRPSGDTGNYLEWNTQADGKGKRYAVGATVPNSVKTLYAKWEIDEQFNLPTGKTYYFDLSSEASKIGTINNAVPDTSLHYVPFTYAGTVNAYNLENKDIGTATTQERANALLSDRSLFVADYNISHTIQWNILNADVNKLIIGKTFDTNYTLRSLSVGSGATGSGDAQRGTPTTNEWDSILNKSPDGIKNWNTIYSWGQDSSVSTPKDNRVDRGKNAARCYDYTDCTYAGNTIGFRPALEVQNPATLGKDGLKAITLDLNGGHLGKDTTVKSMDIVYTGDTYTTPNATGLTRPTGDTRTYFKWNTKADGTGTSYDAGDATVPNSVKTLYAQWKKPVVEQFNLPTGKTYYFDLSGEASKIGSISAINQAVPDTSLHYVPFTYAGTVNAYSLESKDSGNTGASAAATPSDHSLFVADYNISNNTSWANLSAASYIFGKPFDTYYKLRSLSVGCGATGSGVPQGGTPITNEWDSILDKSLDGIKNWRGIYSWGQDTYVSSSGQRALRGYSTIRNFANDNAGNIHANFAFRPALEVLNPTTLGNDGLKAITLDLNGGYLGKDTTVKSMDIVYTGDTYTTPNATGLTRPTGNTGTYFKWNTQADGTGTSYEVGDTTVPNTVKTLYAQWTMPEQFSLPTGGTYYFDLSSEKNNLGTINTAVPDTSLHYVPFTYAGTMNAYNLETTDNGIATTQARADALLSDRNLFVADYPISHTKSWNDLNANNLIFGKPFDTNYTLRSLSMGSYYTGSGDAMRGTPTTNEWDNILNKSFNDIKNCDIYSAGQDTRETAAANRVDRMKRDYSSTLSTNALSNLAFRPALEVLNPTALGKDGLKAVVLNLNGGRFDSNGSATGGEVTSLNIVCAGSTFKAPSAISLICPRGSNSFGWNTAQDGTGKKYAVGAAVPNSVTTLYAQWTTPEQFSLPTGGTYYFDLSSERGYLGTINTVPDQTLHYVPFTYAGTVNAYNLEPTDNGTATTQERADALLSDRSLFVADYAISHTKSWNALNANDLIFGKPFDTNYTLRSLSMGSDVAGFGDARRGTPTTNEWDNILNKSFNDIKNCDIYSAGQDTRETAAANRVDRMKRDYSSTLSTNAQANLAFRPALEVLNPTALGKDGLKAVVLNLNGGSVNGANSINIVCIGDTFKAPSGIGLTRPNGGSSFGWNTAQNGSGTSYEVGDTVPNTVKTLYAQWAPEQFKLPKWQTYYFDLSGVANNIGTINTAVPDQTLHYVPFTYAGTVNAYSLDSSSSNNTNASVAASSYPTNRSLFVADYNINHTITWNTLDVYGFIFGKTFDTNYKLRSLSVGSNSYNSGATPTNNEWDSILTKSGATAPIKNWSGIYSFGQDTTADDASVRAARGFNSAAFWVKGASINSSATYIGFRPALEVLNVGKLGKDGLKKVTLNLNGSTLNGASSINIVCAGATFKAPSGEGLTHPSGKEEDTFVWNTAQDGTGKKYAVGAAVPNSVTTLYVQWTPRIPVTVDNANKTICAGGVPLLVMSGNTVGTTTIYMDTNKNGVVDTGELSLFDAGVLNAPNDNSDLSAYTLYGGESSKALKGDSFLTLAGGKLKTVYGTGKDASATISGSKTVQVQGKPIVTNGIDLASLTGERVLVCGALKGVAGAIRLMKPANAAVGQIMAAATSDTNKPYVSATKFSIDSGELVQDKAASTVVLSGALDASYSGTNITQDKQHFGTGKASYGKEWIGVLLPTPGYKLPENVTMTIAGKAATKGIDYSYNSITGELKIEAVKGNISITADGVPIAYTIIYNANGGLVNGKPSKTVSVNYGDTITFPTANRKAGSSWSFLGWADKPDAVKADYPLNTTTKKALSSIDTAQITLYAVWKSSDNLPTSLQNGSFEVPVNSIFSNMYDYSRTDNIKWLTTALDRKIELGNPSKGLSAAYSAYGTRSASEGLQFAELNATSVAALYQEVATEPGSILYWGLDHRARSKSVSETMEVWIGSETQVNEAINAYKADGNRVSFRTQAVFAKYPTLLRTANITHDWLSWYPVDGEYTVPTGQTATMFAFVSISNPAGNSCGNLLDNVFFSTVKPRERREITIRAGAGGTVRVSDAGGFTEVNKTTTYNKSLELGEMLQATVMADSGYSFNGGYVDGQYYTKENLLTVFSNLRLTMGNTTPKEITILFAKDSTISFLPNGGSYTEEEKTLVADVTNPGNSYTLTTPSREGYAFSGWLVAGTGKTLTAGDVVKYLTSDENGETTLACAGKASVPTEQGMMLIAQWQEALPTLVTTTLTLDSNGGRYGEEISYGSDTTFVEWQTLYELDASYTGDNKLILKAPVRAGYAFTGWKDTTGKYGRVLATGEAIEYTLAGDTAKLTVGQNTMTDAPQTLALTAQWEKMPDPPVITTQPSGKTLTYGYTAGNTLSISATVAAGDTLSYQWYENTTNSNTNGTIINAATANTYTVPTGKSVGSYYYYCVATATESNKSTTTTSNAVTVAVEKATLTASYENERIVYGNRPTLAITVTGFVNGETASNVGVGNSYTAPTIATQIPTAVGSHTLTPSGGTATNYRFTYKEGTLIITADSMTSDVTAIDYTGVYDGTAHGITVALSGKATGAAITYGTTATDCTKPTLTYKDAGSYRVYYKVSKAGYTEITGSAMVNISKKPVRINTVNVNNKTYDGNTSTTGEKITIKDVVAGETVTAGGSITFTDKNAGKNKKVDIAGLTLSGTAAKNYTIAADASDVATTAEITQKQVTLTWQNTDSKTYDGQPSNVTATVASGLVGGDLCNVTVTDGNKTNAGNHTATAALDNHNYSINGNTTEDYSISKAKLNATYEGESIIYMTATLTLAVKVTGFVNGESASNVGTGNTYTAPTVTFPTVQPSDVGIHTLTPSGGSATNYDFTYVSGELNILARDFNMVSIKDYLGDYDAQAHSATLVNQDPTGTGATVKYYSNEACTAGETDTAPTRTDVGTSTVYYKITAPGFTPVTGKATITINKKKVTPSINTVDNKSYDGSTTATGTIKLTGVATADMANVNASGSITFTDKNAGTNKSVTVTGIKLGGTKENNYELTATVLNAATKATITPKEITLTWSGHTTLTYTAMAQNVTAAIPTGAVVTGDTVTLTVTGGKKTSVGTGYTATAAIDNSNYNLTNATQNYDIGKATLTANYENESIVYGNRPTLAVTVTGFVNGESAITAANYTAPTISTTPIPTAAGTHTMTLKGGTADNYSFTLQTGTLTITAADMKHEVTSSSYDDVYDGLAHGITVNIPTGATVTYYSDAALTNELKGGAEKITHVANSPKTVYYKVTKPNYKDVTGKETITITKKTLTPALNTLDSKTYDGKTDSTGSTLTLLGVIGSDKVTANATITFTDEKAGKNKKVNVKNIKLDGAEKDNYTLSTTTLKDATTGAEIRQKEVTLTWSGYDKLVYDGKAKNVTAVASALLLGEHCDVTVSDGKETLPGTYTATATALSNPNYKLPVTPTKSYTIAPADFTITATPYEGMFDNVAHRSVTLTDTLPTDSIAYSIDAGKTWTTSVPQVGAVGDTIIQIKVMRQYHKTVTQTVTAKVWQAPIIKLLKPMFDSTDLKKATLGGTVTQGSFLITTQTLEYRRVGSNTWATLNAGTTVGTVTTYKETVTTLAENTNYELRLSATDDKNNKTSETILFRTQSTTPPTGAIEGEVGGGKGKITVTLEIGNNIVDTITGLNNSDTFSFDKLTDGEYNLVATDGTYTVTKMATVTNGGTTKLSLLLVGSKQSTVKVNGMAPPVAVNGLNEIFTTNLYTSNQTATGTVSGGGTVEMRLTADEAKKQDEINAIRQAATDRRTIGMMTDLTVDMITTPYGGLSSVENISDTETLLEIAIPLKAEIQGKQNYRMFSYHNGNVNELPQISTSGMPTSEGFRMGGNYAYLYAHKFSTYAITYDKPGEGESGGGEGGGESGGGTQIPYYTITPTKSAGGQITPDKPVSVRGGNSAAFTMTPEEGYEINEVKVDGKNIGAKTEYLFTDVWGNHTIAVSFKKAATIPPAIPKPETKPETKPGTVPGTVPGEIDSDNKPNGKHDVDKDSKPSEKLDEENSLDQQKENIKKDLISKRDDAIAALPDTLTAEQRQDAIDALNKICEDAIKALNRATSASEISDILNNAIQAFRDVVEQSGGEVSVNKPGSADGKRPFMLLSALLALLAVLLAAVAILKKCTKKRKLIAILGALLAVIIFLITTGWNGIAFANLWTIAVALATALPAIIVIKKIKEEEEEELAQEENLQ